MDKSFMGVFNHFHPASDLKSDKMGSYLRTLTGFENGRVIYDSYFVAANIRSKICAQETCSLTEMYNLVQAGELIPIIDAKPSTKVLVAKDVVTLGTQLRATAEAWVKKDLNIAQTLKRASGIVVAVGREMEEHADD